MGSILYGPVPSWRLGRSLGIDLISTPHKVCSFDCVYCQLGGTFHPLMRRREFVGVAQLSEALAALGEVEVDYATFSGMGEPTLASNLGEAIRTVKSVLAVPVAVLTNSSLMSREDVRQDLGEADLVVAKLDAPDEARFRHINRPRLRTSLREIVEAIRLFRASYRGRLALQMMFIEANRDAAAAMATLARQIGPDQAQINTPLRPCAERPLSPGEILAVRAEFSGMTGVVTVYEATPSAVSPMDAGETERRRPSALPEGGSRVDV